MTNMALREWLDQFYENFPFIKNKYLQFTGLESGIFYNIQDLNMNSQVKNTDSYIYIDSYEPIMITLETVNLYAVLFPEELGKHYDSNISQEFE